MNKFLVTFFKLLLASTLYWLLAFLLFISIRYHGLEQEINFYLDEPQIFPTEAFYELALILGLIIGFIYAVIETASDALTNKLALGLTIAAKSLLYFLLMVILLTFTITLVEQQADIDLPNEGNWWQTNPFFWNTIIFFIVASVIFQLIRIAIDRFGRGNFISILLGRYKRPKEEEHVLMFLDLKDSTSIAEKLGHHLYSEFIQDCFTDLDRVLNRYDAKVYQYVGDEAVIHWTVKRGFRNNSCIRLFTAFHKRLNRRHSYYSRKFGVTPQFKAGIHYGKLMVVEVGNQKKELAFHGDVINTAARLQGCCNELGENLLVSEDVLEKLNISKTHYKLMSRDMELKGRSEHIKIYAIKIDY